MCDEQVRVLVVGTVAGVGVENQLRVRGVLRQQVGVDRGDDRAGDVLALSFSYMGSALTVWS